MISDIKYCVKNTFWKNCLDTSVPIPDIWNAADTSLGPRRHLNEEDAPHSEGHVCLGTSRLHHASHCRRAYLGKTGTDLDQCPLLGERVHRCHRLGGSDGSQLQEARLWVLGRRTDLPRAGSGHGAGNLDLAERLESSGHGSRGENRVFRCHRLDRGGEAEESPATRVPAGHAQPSRLGTGGWHALL